MILNKIIALISLTTLLYGCASPKANIPLVFGQSHTVGISIGGSAADQGVDFTLGYKDKELWVSPNNAHPNEKGQDIASSAIKEILIKDYLYNLTK